LIFSNIFAEKAYVRRPNENWTLSEIPEHLQELHRRMYADGQTSLSQEEFFAEYNARMGAISTNRNKRKFAGA